MKVLLLKDVYKLGRAGDVKKVADGYGRNFLIPQNLAVLATPGAIKRAENIRTRAAAQRAVLNQEMGGVADLIKGLVIGFPARAGETGKLYGSITPQMIADEISRKAKTPVDRRNIECEPIRTLGEHKCIVRLTVDLVPEVMIIVHREGETPAALVEKPVEEEKPAETVETENA
ncbi:MAG: 50S ribosomal protein L9 [Anaerolineaceae bacterium]|nr:50S ribosomal protein L9 [Anaerolineaceae bacterium]